MKRGITCVRPGARLSLTSLATPAHNLATPAHNLSLSILTLNSQFSGVVKLVNNKRAPGLIIFRLMTHKL